MGLFDKQAPVNEERVPVQEETTQQEITFLEADAGVGLKDIEQAAASVPFLQLTQANSDIVTTGGAPAGVFVNSVTKEVYGNTIHVIICKFAVAWAERDDSGKTVNRYEVGGIKVNGDSYKGMTNPATGNKIVETWYYQVLVMEHPEAGFMIFSSTPGNMRYLKAFNSMIRTLRLPSGSVAPLYGGVWEWKINPDVSKKGKPYYSFKNGIKFAGWIPRKLYQEAVLPIKDEQIMLPAPTNELIEAEADVEDAVIVENNKY